MTRLQFLAGCLPIHLVLEKELELERNLEYISKNDDKLDFNKRSNRYNISYPKI